MLSAFETTFMPLALVYVSPQLPLNPPIQGPPGGDRRPKGSPEPKGKVLPGLWHPRLHSRHSFLEFVDSSSDPVLVGR